ncbi:MAG: glycoside hydrolase family 3 C-terminal domain-containing protein [Anaerolineales bacterium]|nr:glycoside hydrolase family 3 C-terminal domain-containing protein [Anaerolineales bacterium]
MNERVEALKAGVELEMPGANNGNDQRIVAAVRSGQLAEATLDRAAVRILALIFKAQAMLAQDFTYDPQAHHALARRVAGEGAVLLKNEGGLLPLPADAKIALIGRFARSPRYQGAGSSLINPARLDNLYDELSKLIGEANLAYAPGYTEKGDAADEGLIQEALDIAGKADIILVCAGLTDMYEVEGIDRRHMRLPAGHDVLIQRLAAAHKNLVVVLSNGSPVEMPWVEAVPAILEGYLGGQAGAGALADILTGRVNPSGKLAETFPLKLQDTPAQPYPGGPATVEYRESIYVGYRYYDTAGMEVLFPFGHGLSYTTFSYRDLGVKLDGDTVTATFKIKNTGAVAGKEVVQLYVRDLESSLFRPDKELKGFAKVELAPGEETEVSLTLDQRAFAFYDTGSQDWIVEPGDFEILIGASSRDIRLTANLHLTAAHGAASPVDPAKPAKPAAYYHVSKDHPFSQADFEALLGHPVPPNLPTPKGSYNLNTPLKEMRDSFVGRQIFKMMVGQIEKMVKGQEDTPTGLLLRAMAQEMPMRSMLMFGGPLNRPKVEALLLMINGHFLKGLLAFIRAR